jgi:tRNA A37 threonylcarbamoyladenosine synthetase subunit TsaC/SUA5/YrdC
MSIEQAVAALRRGEIVGVPTDTLYGIAADPSAKTHLARFSSSRDALPTSLWRFSSHRWNRA